ncbi:LAFE_0D05270g1_1 [Lachancea fermentati]|uniref:LAFE_0D05270g1_1 n=1 Tax=Lachancea fermentati TaxID=4955 RepID=A0A1G4MB76_LACFM|nr:LAFE_0D05270g1_1 [Lachancea fermentati]
MLSYEEYKTQLLQDIFPLLQRWHLSKHVVFNADAHTVRVKAQNPLIANCDIELQIEYSHLYHEPLLIFRFWNTTLIDGVEQSQIWLPDDLPSVLNMKGFNTGLDHVDKESKTIWFSAHCCDTSKVVGSDTSSYLSRWCSVYFTLFDCSFANVYMPKVKS